MREVIYRMALAMQHKLNEFTPNYFFTLGQCPFLPDVEPLVKYFLTNTTAFIRCVDNGQEIFAECGIDGEWSKSDDICTSTSEMMPKGKF